MERWRGVLKASLTNAKKTPAAAGNPQFTVSASLRLSPSSKTLTVPSANAVFFYGDRVEGTGNDVIEKMSDGRNVAELLVEKFGETVNTWVVEASTFRGPFAVYKEFIAPPVDSLGNPTGCDYDPDRFPASSSIVRLLSNCTEQVKEILSKKQQSEQCDISHSTSSPPQPKSILLGFSKGGILLNQILTELAHFNSSRPTRSTNDHIDRLSECFPISKDSFLNSISQIHYIDVGLNCSGAYITSLDVIKNIITSDLSPSLRVVLHGTPRQWCDKNRPWIKKEKDTLLQILKDEARRSRGRLEVIERFYFANMASSLHMHFEIIKELNIS